MKLKTSVLNFIKLIKLKTLVFILSIEII